MTAPFAAANLLESTTTETGNAREISTQSVPSNRAPGRSNQDGAEEETRQNRKFEMRTRGQTVEQLNPVHIEETGFVAQKFTATGKRLQTLNIALFPNVQEDALNGTIIDLDGILLAFEPIPDDPPGSFRVITLDPRAQSGRGWDVLTEVSAPYLADYIGAVEADATLKQASGMELRRNALFHAKLTIDLQSGVWWLADFDDSTARRRPLPESRSGPREITVSNGSGGVTTLISALITEHEK